MYCIPCLRLPPESDVPTLEDRRINLALITSGFYGAGGYTGQQDQSCRDEVKYALGLNNAPGSFCYNSGSYLVFPGTHQ